MGMALSMKLGQTPKSKSPAVAKVSKGMTVDDLRDFARKPKGKKAR